MDLNKIIQQVGRTSEHSMRSSVDLLEKMIDTAPNSIDRKLVKQEMIVYLIQLTHDYKD